VGVANFILGQSIVARIKILSEMYCSQGVANFFLGQSIGMSAFWGLVGVANFLELTIFFLGQSIGIDENITFQLKFLF